MTTVGIIANPASGKDIRRLVAFGSVFNNQEKVNIVRRVLIGLQATGVDNVIFMPDYFDIGKKASEGCKLSLSTNTLEMMMRGNQEDSTQAARLMNELGVGSIVVLGGDGTNRVVAKGCGDIPLMPISTGTNNVFPSMIEGTIAGLAAGIIAMGIVEIEISSSRTKRLEVERDGQLIDIALVDIAVYDNLFIGTRAIWDMGKVKEVITTRACPSNIGLSSIGGCLYPKSLNSKHGVYIKIDEEATKQIVAPIAPGLVTKVGIDSYRLLSIGECIEVNFKPSILALDGEREIEVKNEDNVTLRLTANGPRVIDINITLEEAARKGFFWANCD